MVKMESRSILLGGTVIIVMVGGATSAGWYNAVGRAKVSHQLQQCFEDFFFVMRYPIIIENTA